MKTTSQKAKPKRAQSQLRLVMRPAVPATGPAPEERKSLVVAGLFAGIGGLELGLHRAGHRTNFLCELDPGARAVLDAHFPNVSKHGDICSLRALPKETTLVAAGFPCQDLSQAGKTVGIGGARSGLVAEVFRLLEKRRVPWVLLENVPFMLQLSRGRALDVIVDALERLGYRWAYRVVDSRAFGLPQRRARVFLLASIKEDPRDVLFVDDQSGTRGDEAPGDVACGFYWTEGIRGLGWAVDSVPTLKAGSTVGIPSPPAILLPDGRVVKPDVRDAERMQGFDADWTKPAELVSRRGHRWKLIGNAVTVDVAEWIGSRLLKPGKFVQVDAGRVLAGHAWPKVAWNIGEGRFTAELSAWPMRRRGPHLTEFLRYDPGLLSAKATAGFLARAESSSLRFPSGFLAAIGDHLRRMKTSVAA